MKNLITLIFILSSIALFGQGENTLPANKTIGGSNDGVVTGYNYNKSTGVATLTRSTGGSITTTDISDVTLSNAPFFGSATSRIGVDTVSNKLYFDSAGVWATLNVGSSSIDWSNILNVPAGFADNIDNDTFNVHLLGVTPSDTARWSTDLYNAILQSVTALDTARWGTDNDTFNPILQSVTTTDTANWGTDTFNPVLQGVTVSDTARWGAAGGNPVLANVTALDTARWALDTSGTAHILADKDTSLSNELISDFSIVAGDTLVLTEAGVTRKVGLPASPTLPAGSVIEQAETTAFGDSTATWQQVVDQMRDSISIDTAYDYTEFRALNSKSKFVLITKDGLHGLFKRTSGKTDDGGIYIEDASGQDWERVREQAYINPMWFGAVADGVTDAAPAIHAAMNWGGVRNHVKIPSGNFYCDTTLRITAGSILEGSGRKDGAGRTGTNLIFPSGVDGIHLVYDNSELDYGQYSVVENLNLTAQAKNTASVTGSITASSNIVNLDAPGDFVDGQTILIRGAIAATLANGRLGTTTIGSDTVFVDVSSGFWIVGQHATVTGAGFSTHAEVIELGSGWIRLDETATAAVTNAKMNYYEDIHAKILSGGGTNTLTIDLRVGAGLTKPTTIAHADAGIYIQTVATVRNVFIRNFQGAAINQVGQASSGTPVGELNSNVAYFERIVATGNLNGYRCYSNDVNVTTLNSCDFRSNVEFNIVDNSLLGINLSGVHTQSARAWRTTGGSNQQTVLTGCYTEGGGSWSFGTGTLLVGGVMGGVNSAKYGGSYVTANSGNTTVADLVVGATTDPYTYMFNPRTFGIRIFTDIFAGGRKDIRMQNSSIPQDGVAGQFNIYAKDGGTASIGSLSLGFVTDANSLGLRPGSVIFPNGIGVGRADIGARSSNVRHFFSTFGTPTTGSFKAGDIAFNSGWTLGEPFAWICTASGSPGTWIEFGAKETALSDADGDTKIQVEESADEDIIRFDALGQQIAHWNNDSLAFQRRLLLESTTNTPALLFRNTTYGAQGLRIGMNTLGNGQIYHEPSGTNLFINEAGSMFNTVPTNLASAWKVQAMGESESYLNVRSTTGARMLDLGNINVAAKLPTTDQTGRDAMYAEAGATMFNTTTGKLNVHDGTQWNETGGGSNTLDTVMMPFTVYPGDQPWSGNATGSGKLENINFFSCAALAGYELYGATFQVLEAGAGTGTVDVQVNITGTTSGNTFAHTWAVGDEIKSNTGGTGLVMTGDEKIRLQYPINHSITDLPKGLGATFIFVKQ